MAGYCTAEMNNNLDIDCGKGNYDAADDLLFDPTLLDSVDLTKAKCPVQPLIDARRPGEHLVMRPLHVGDFRKNYLGLLSQLTDVGNVDESDFIKRFRLLQSHSQTHYILVVEDVSKDCVVATCTLVIERKFIHSCGARGRLEDLVVLKEYRNRQLGKLLLESARQLAHRLGCYKVSLECKDTLIPYYERFGFCKEEGNSNFLVQRFY